jgi:hypothetical protein
MISSELTKEEWEYLHEVLLFQRLLDQKHRRKIDEIRQKILSQIEWEQMKVDIDKERIEAEDKEDNKYRKKIIK